MRPVHQWVEGHARMDPDRIALVTDDGRITYGELAARGRRAARVLRSLGVGRGDRFAVLAFNLPEFLELLLAAGWTGSILVPLNYRLSPRELAFQLDDSRCSLLFVGSEQAALVAPIIEASGLTWEQVVALDGDELPPQVRRYARLAASAGPEQGPPGEPGPAGVPPAASPPGEAGADDALLICYTSGTTGRPKGAVLTHTNMFANAVNDIVPLGFTYRDRFLTLLPLIHVGGIGLFTLPALLVGATVIMPRRFDPAGALALAERERATVIMVVPTVLKMLVESPAWERTDLSSVRAVVNGGDRCPLELVRRVRERGLAMGGGYGLTESAPTAYLMPADQFEAGTRAEGFIGKPGLLTEVRIVREDGSDCDVGEVGEIWLRGPNIFAGYWHLPRETAEAFTDGWFRTGDLAYRDADGHTFVVGRKKEMIKSGGENIYPAEVEAVLTSHPAVAEACVIGRPDPQWIEVPVAVVALRAGTHVSAEELQDYARQRLARFKVPKDIVFVEALPRTSIGKVARGEVRAIYERHRAPGH